MTETYTPDTSLHTLQKVFGTIGAVALIGTSMAALYEYGDDYGIGFSFSMLIVALTGVLIGANAFAPHNK